MITIHETGQDGSTRSWRMTTGACPRCGSECTVENPVSPPAQPRTLCWFCGYAEGYHFPAAPPSGTFASR